MRKHAETAQNLQGAATAHGWDIVEVRSESNPAKVYRVDITLGLCDCPAWKFQRGQGTRAVCKHLKKLGFKQLVEGGEIMEPQKAAVGQKLKVEN